MADYYVEFATTRTREEFANACSYPFLVGEAVLRQPRDAREGKEFESGRTFPRSEEQIARSERSQRLVLPVHKTQSVFPSMITVGRTKNNDVVLADVLISKLHAFFRVVGDHLELADGGSANGTRVGDRLLVPKGPGVRVRSGDIISFAQLRFRFLDPGACWDALRVG